jgi:hypothetical protein
MTAFSSTFGRLACLKVAGRPLYWESQAQASLDPWGSNAARSIPTAPEGSVSSTRPRKGHAL